MVKSFDSFNPTAPAVVDTLDEIQADLDVLRGQIYTLDSDWSTRFDTACIKGTSWRKKSEALARWAGEEFANRYTASL